MKRSGASFQAARSGDAIYLRIRGLANMVNAPTLEAFAEKAIDSGARQLVLDLEECRGIDSTFMGLLLTISRRLSEQGPAGNGSPSGAVLINVDAHALKQLASVGLDTLLTIRSGHSEAPADLEMTDVDVPAVRPRDRLKLMVRAHRELLKADPRNEAKFGDFLNQIVAELKA